MVRITNSQHSTNKIQNEYCALLGYYTVKSGKFLPSFQDKLSVPSAIFDPCRWDKLIATLNRNSENTYVISKTTIHTQPMLYINSIADMNIVASMTP